MFSLLVQNHILIAVGITGTRPLTVALTGQERCWLTAFVMDEEEIEEEEEVVRVREILRRGELKQELMAFHHSSPLSLSLLSPSLAV